MESSWLYIHVLFPPAHLTPSVQRIKLFITHQQSPNGSPTVTSDLASQKLIWSLFPLCYSPSFDFVISVNGNLLTQMFKAKLWETFPPTTNHQALFFPPYVIFLKPSLFLFSASIVFILFLKMSHLWWHILLISLTPDYCPSINYPIVGQSGFLKNTKMILGLKHLQYLLCLNVVFRNPNPLLWHTNCFIIWPQSYAVT